MAHDWKPTATRSATTDPKVVAVPRRSAGAAQSRPEDGTLATTSGWATPFADIRVAAAVDEFIRAAGEGRALNRSGRPYRPSAFRDLRGCLEYHVVPHLGDLRLADVRRRHLQALVDRLAANGLSISRIRSVISATRALYAYAIEQGYVEFSPADGLVVPHEVGTGDHEPPSGWSDEPDLQWEEAPPRRIDRRARDTRLPPPESPEREPDGLDRQPLALLPERILSLVLRTVVVIFVLIALVTITESA